MITRQALAALERRFRHYVEADNTRDKILSNLLEIAEEYERDGKQEQVKSWLDRAAQWELASIPIYR